MKLSAVIEVLFAFGLEAVFLADRFGVPVLRPLVAAVTVASCLGYLSLVALVDEIRARGSVR